jgi:hypothetical protein
MRGPFGAPHSLQSAPHQVPYTYEQTIRTIKKDTR